MKIAISCHNNSEIKIADVCGELTGRGAIEFGKRLYTLLDEGSRYLIINLTQVKKADGMWINILEDFIERGLRFRLVHADLEIQNLLKLSRKDGIIRMCNCREHEEAVSQFEKEMREEKDAEGDGARGRKYVRVNVSFRAEFKRHAEHGEEIMCKANIRNLSEGGILASSITAFDGHTGERIKELELIGRELRNINFSMNGSSKLIEIDGKCVWEDRENGNQYAGIYFKGTSQNQIEMIREYVHLHSHN